MNTSKKNIIGCFIFRNEGDGILTSKYMNKSEQGAEACKLLNKSTDNPDDPFCGTYVTSWIERKDKHEKAKLNIEKKEDRYTLSWFKYNDSSHQLFWGIGMTISGILVGSYWD